jgi:hypothetical protein
VQDAFAIVLFAVIGVGLVVGVATFVVRGRLYDQIGRGGLSLDTPDRPRAAPAPASPAAQREREDEIRQMLAARNERRARRGEAPLDIDAEVAKLTAPAPASSDPELVEEVRALVMARNERRARAGEAPLDVDAEVERQLRELGA